MWDKKLCDDKFVLMAKMNRDCNVAVKSPVGVTERFVLKEIEIQGTVLSPPKCSVQLDTLGIEAYV